MKDTIIIERLIELNHISKKIKRIFFEDDFNNKIKKNTFKKFKFITHLIFGNFFNQKIKKGVLPKKLKSLTFGFSFDKKINKNVLPKNLEFLSLRNTNCFILKKMSFLNY